MPQFPGRVVVHSFTISGGRFPLKLTTNVVSCFLGIWQMCAFIKKGFKKDVPMSCCSFIFLLDGSRGTTIFARCKKDVAMSCFSFRFVSDGSRGKTMFPDAPHFMLRRAQVQDKEKQRSYGVSLDLFASK